MARTIQVHEVRCKSVLNRVQSEMMPFKWSINPYRGCQHACVYCYARRYHEYLDLGPGRDFETQIFVKVNAPEVLRTELARPSWRREWVAVGTAVDPYQPAEGRYKITRGVLESLCDYDTPVSIVTKNTMIVRDADILERLSRGAGCRVYFSLSTIEERLARKLEPGTPPPLARLKVMRQLVERGIEAGVLVAPVLPGITDDDAALRRVALAAAAHGARYLSGAPLRLQGSVRGVYLSFIEEAFPRLRKLYETMYTGDYAPRGYRQRIGAKLHEMEKILELGGRLGYGEKRSPTPTDETPGVALVGPGELRSSSDHGQSASIRHPAGIGSGRRKPDLDSGRHLRTGSVKGIAIGNGAAQLCLFG